MNDTNLGAAYDVTMSPPMSPSVVLIVSAMCQMITEQKMRDSVNNISMTVEQMTWNIFSTPMHPGGV